MMQLITVLIFVLTSVALLYQIVSLQVDLMMPRIRSVGLFAVLGLVASGSASTFVTDAQHIVDTGYAKYLGALTAPFSVAYLGVPYAEPPLGNMRFRAPAALDTESLKRNKSVVDATTYPDFCVQGSIGQGDAGGAGSEDCLKVNIYTPANATSHSKCKVTVLICRVSFADLR